MAMYIKMDGVTGESTTSGLEGYTEITGVSWGSSRNSTAALGSSGATEPRLRPLTFKKETDNTSTVFYMKALVGTFSNNITIKLVRTGPSGPIVYWQIDMANAGISAVEMVGDGDRPNETFTIDYKKITFTYFKYDDDLMPSSDSWGYDIPTNVGA